MLSLNFFFLIFLQFFIGNARELIFVYEHARHGARGPSSGFRAIFDNGTDEYGVKWITDGELTQIGKRQHYFLGIRNRIKYGNLINFKKYDPMEILIHSTDYNRSQQSIMSELYGMYEGLEEVELNEEEKHYTMVNNWYIKNKTLSNEINDSLTDIGNRINKRSFPIFNIHKFPDNRIFLVDHCDKLRNYRDENAWPTVEKYLDDFNKEFLEPFKNFTKIQDKKYFNNYDNMKSMTDHFICDVDNKKDLHHLEEAGLNITRFYNFSKQFYGNFIFDYFVDKYTSGLEETHLMQDMLGYMEARKNNIGNTTYKAPKMVMDCGHDTTVGPIARFVDSVFNCGYHKFCEFACNVFFELYKEDNGTLTVDYYMDDEKLLDSIEYNYFKKEMQSHFWNDTYMGEFCGTEKDTEAKQKGKIEEYSSVLFGISIVTSILLIIFVTSTIVIFRRLKKLQKKLDENPLMEKEMEGSELPSLLT